VLGDEAEGDDEFDAFEYVAKMREESGEDLEDIQFIAAIRGAHDVLTPTDMGNTCFAVDFPH
jgi:hypothetical protein